MRTSTFARLAAAAAIVALAAPTLAKDAKSGPRYGTFGVDLTTQDKARGTSVRRSPPIAPRPAIGW
jgi:putative endopeptidase